jgi:hypothetical protein
MIVYFVMIFRREKVYCGGNMSVLCKVFVHIFIYQVTLNVAVFQIYPINDWSNTAY